MGLMRWEPMFGLTRLRDEMDRMFEEAFRGFPLREEEGLRVPSVDLSEDENEVKLTAELPGVDKDHLQVEVLPEAVSIKGEIRKEEEKKGRGYIRRERRMGYFERTVPLPAEVKPGESKATFKDGLLSITLPKSEEARKRHPVRVEVQAA